MHRCKKNSPTSLFNIHTEGHRLVKNESSLVNVSSQRKYLVLLALCEQTVSADACKAEGMIIVFVSVLDTVSISSLSSCPFVQLEK